MVKQIYKKRTYKPSKNSNKTPDSINTAKYLVIVESPSKCPKIEHYLGPNYSCISSKGHIRTITNLKSIDTKNNYQTTYNVLEDKKSHIEWMKTIIDKFPKPNIILATDDDREGEAIAWHICDTFDLDIHTTKRIIFHEITQSALLKAVENPTIINMNIVKAQQSRQILDVLVGFKISPILWKFLYRNSENSLSAGRCQTPALRLVYDNEIEQQSKKIEYKYKIEATFFQKKLKFGLSQEFGFREQVLEFLEKSKTFSHTLSIGDKKSSVKSPPTPFNTSSLLQTASSVLHIRPKETMSLCQQLYQDGLITYMRTESQGYAGDFIQIAFGYISSKFADAKYLRNREEIENIDDKNPHEAIRVTNIHTESIVSENTKAATLYRLIWRNTIQSCMSTAKYENTPVYISCPQVTIKELSSDKPVFRYSHTVEIPLFLGWKAITEDTNIAEQQNAGASLLFYIKNFEKKAVPYERITSNITIHGKHSHYTEATLIKQLEDLGIGRPSTFAMIVETIIERGYVKKTDIEGEKITAEEFCLVNSEITVVQTEKIFGKETGKLVIQPIGILVSNFLNQHFTDLFSYDYTKKMETDLDKISANSTGASLTSADEKSIEWFHVCQTCEDEINRALKPIAKISKQVFPIKGTSEYILVYEKYGLVLRKVLTDGSYEYKSIKQTMQIDLGKLMAGDYHIDELIGEANEKIIGEYEGNTILLKSGPYGDYVEHCGKKESVRNICKREEQSITDESEIAHRFIEKTAASTDAKIIRELTAELSIRNGKFGAYIYYKTEKMRKPTFYNIQKFKESYRHCSEEVLLQWIKDTYNI